MFPLRKSVRLFSEKRDTSCPRNQSSPDVGLSSNPSIFNKVDLPHPDGPMIATNSPRLISIFTSFKAVVCTFSVPVDWTEGFWKDAFDNNASHTVPHLRKMFESKEISHVLENFRICAGESDGNFGGTDFGDGDFYKWMEAAMYTAVKTLDAMFLGITQQAFNAVRKLVLVHHPVAE